MDSFVTMQTFGLIQWEALCQLTMMPHEEAELAQMLAKGVESDVLLCRLPQRWDGGEVSIGQQKVRSAASWKGLRVRESVSRRGVEVMSCERLLAVVCWLVTQVLRGPWQVCRQAIIGRRWRRVRRRMCGAHI